MSRCGQRLKRKEKKNKEEHSSAKDIINMNFQPTLSLVHMQIITREYNQTN